MKEVVFKLDMSPGDVCMMTGAVESLHLQFPGKYRTDYQGAVREMFHYNPLIRSVGPGAQVVDCTRPPVRENEGRAIHFMDIFCEMIAKQLDEPTFRLQVNKPVLHLNQSEKSIVPPWGRYCLIVSGGKLDYPSKHIGIKISQEIADHCRSRNVAVVQLGHDGTDHRHPAIAGAVDLRGQTTVRELLRLVYHSSFVVCGITLLQHLSAAFSVPAVIYAGGRENPALTCYQNQVFLSTVGHMDCCQTPCWAGRVVPLPQDDMGWQNTTRLCQLPILGPDNWHVAGCMDRIGSAPAVQAIDRIISGWN